MQSKGAGEPGMDYRMVSKDQLSESRGLDFLETLGSWDYEVVMRETWESQPGLELHTYWGSQVNE